MEWYGKYKVEELRRIRLKRVCSISRNWNIIGVRLEFCRTLQEIVWKCMDSIGRSALFRSWSGNYSARNYSTALPGNFRVNI